MTTRFLTRSSWATSLLALLLLSACHAERAVVDDVVAIGPNQLLEVAVGDRFDVLLRAISLGSYQSPPSISSPSVQFLEVTVVQEAPIPPGGPLQRFRFRATAPGTAVLTFTPTQPGSDATANIVVH